MNDETDDRGSAMDDRDGGGAAGGADSQEPLRVRLERFGDAHDSFDWESGEVDYVRDLHLTVADVPELVAIARRWIQPHGWTDKADMSGYARVHAWRCLGQLRATEVIGPLLDMIEPLDASGDDWFLHEFPRVFGWIGPASLAPIREYLFNAGHHCYPRVCAASALKQLALRHPDLRAEVVKALTDVLPAEKAQPQDLDHMKDEEELQEVLRGLTRPVECPLVSTIRLGFF